MKYNNNIPGAILIIREITGLEHHIPMPEMERKVCQNTLMFDMMKAETAKKKKHK